MEAQVFVSMRILTGILDSSANDTSIPRAFVGFYSTVPWLSSERTEGCGNMSKYE